MQSRMNIALKTAIIESRKKQKRIAKLAKIRESRLSKIVHGEKASDAERESLATVLERSQSELFGVEAPAVNAPMAEAS